MTMHYTYDQKSKLYRGARLLRDEVLLQELKKQMQLAKKRDRREWKDILRSHRKRQRLSESHLDLAGPW